MLEHPVMSHISGTLVALSRHDMSLLNHFAGRGFPSPRSRLS